MLNHQIDVVTFLLRYPDKWKSYNNSEASVEVVCSLVNLGIAKTNGRNQIKLKSVTKARDFLNET